MWVVSGAISLILFLFLHYVFDERINNLPTARTLEHPAHQVVDTNVSNSNLVDKLGALLFPHSQLNTMCSAIHYSMSHMGWMMLSNLYRNELKHAKITLPIIIKFSGYNTFMLTSWLHIHKK